ncbi:MAG TPA: STAS domain-containing protein [Vicinamibacterales bacterium]|nr:STAS domain-containing protein [Vicinamibacterales bacterium]
MAYARVKTADILRNDTTGLLADWMSELSASSDNRISDRDVEGQASEFLKLVASASEANADVMSSDWAPVRSFLDDVSRTRAMQGFSAQETATFVFSLKKPLFERIRRATEKDAVALAEETWAATELIDTLGMHTVKAFQKSREEIIIRQQEEMLELSTPVVKLWDGIIALPMIGTLDSARTQIVMESLLRRIVEIGAEIAIIDITGVPTVDTLVAQHLLKTVTAIRLMGADCIISGIRPQIAQTIVHLGVDLQGVTTKSTLADALAIALQRTGQTVSKVKPS